MVSHRGPGGPHRRADEHERWSAQQLHGLLRALGFGHCVHACCTQRHFAACLLQDALWGQGQPKLGMVDAMLVPRLSLMCCVCNCEVLGYLSTNLDIRASQSRNPRITHRSGLVRMQACGHIIMHHGGMPLSLCHPYTIGSLRFACCNPLLTVLREVPHHWQSGHRLCRLATLLAVWTWNHNSTTQHCHTQVCERSQSEPRA